MTRTLAVQYTAARTLQTGPATTDTNTLLDLMEVRRLFEPAATALAATRILDSDLKEVKQHLDAMREARDDVELLNKHDAAFHHAVISATPTTPW